MQKELESKKEIMHFTGYLNNEIVCERDVLVGADCCHVNYFGTEPLTQVIYGISDAVRESKFCELVTTENIRAIIPSFYAFRDTIDENLSYENKLEMIIDWFSSHNCIIEARINDLIFGEILFSFVENGQTVNMIMLIDEYLRFCGFRN